MGVTVLTSLDTNALSELGFDPNVARQVRAGKQANKAGLRGLVCSPLETSRAPSNGPAQHAIGDARDSPRFQTCRMIQKRTLTPTRGDPGRRELAGHRTSYLRS
jgi:orotidine-5'-phosphate decarboxylase